MDVPHTRMHIPTPLARAYRGHDRVETIVYTPLYTPIITPMSADLRQQGIGNGRIGTMQELINIKRDWHGVTRT